MSDRHSDDDRNRMDHGVHNGFSGLDSRIQRAALASRHKTRRLRKSHGKAEDADHESMKREIAELRAVLANVTDVLRQMHAQQTPSVSLLDEALLSLEAKQHPVEDVQISRSLIEALSADSD